MQFAGDLGCQRLVALRVQLSPAMFTYMGKERQELCSLESVAPASGPDGPQIDR
jgi:hypothetical protein